MSGGKISPHSMFARPVAPADIKPLLQAVDCVVRVIRDLATHIDSPAAWRVHNEQIASRRIDLLLDYLSPEVTHYLAAILEMLRRDELDGGGRIDDSRMRELYRLLRKVEASLQESNRELHSDPAQDHGKAEALPRESDGRSPIAQTDSGSVVLFDRHDRPIVNGNEKKTLTNAQYDVVFALLQTGDKGLTKDELDRESRRGDARKILKRLSDADSDWQSVISFPGTTGKGYRIT